MNWRRMIAGGCLAAACTAPALAQVAGGASLGNLGYSLFDLDTTDAAQPSLQFTTLDNILGGNRTGFAQVVYMERGEGVDLMQTGYASGDPLVASYAERVGSASASLAGRGGVGMDQELARTVDVPNADALRVQFTTYSWSDPVMFTLAPHTRVTFTATLSAWAEVEEAASHFAHFETLGYVRVFDYLNPNNIQPADGRLVVAGNQPGQDLGLDESFLLSVSYDNPGDTPRSAYAVLNLQGSSWTVPVSAVPEPAPLAMLAAAGLLFGLRQRRS